VVEEEPTAQELREVELQTENRMPEQREEGETA
jgi:hypothetical protein